MGGSNYDNITEKERSFNRIVLRRLVGQGRIYVLVSTGRKKVYRILCSKTIGIANGGSLVLQSHQKEKMHSELVMKRNENRISKLIKKKLADSAAAMADEV